LARRRGGRGAQADRRRHPSPRHRRRGGARAAGRRAPRFQAGGRSAATPPEPAPFGAFEPAKGRAHRGALSQVPIDGSLGAGGAQEVALMCLHLPWLLLAVAASAAWLSVLLYRRRDPSLRGLSWVLLANILLPVAALATGRECGLLGWLALFVFALTVVVPALLRVLEPRAQVLGRAEWAARLCALRAALQPGGPASRDRDLRAALAAARAGRTDDHLALLKARLNRAGSAARVQALREQMLYLLLQSRRFADAVALYEADPFAIETQPLAASGLVRAYCELGQLDRAARVLRALEAGPAALDLAAAAQLNHARLMFLAFSGQARAVADLL